MKLPIPTAADIFGFDVKPLSSQQDVPANPVEYGEKKILLAWESLSRPHQADFTEGKLSRTFTVILVVVAFILIVLQMYPLLLVIGSMFFVNYVLNKVPPEKIGYSISTHGISVGDAIYYWPNLVSYFFKDADNSHVLVIDLVSSALPRVYLTYLVKDKEKIKELLSQHIVFIEKEPKSVIDRTYDSMVDKLNLK